MKNNGLFESFGLKVPKSHFQKQSADKVISEIALFSSVSRISSIGRRSEGGGIVEMG